MSMNRIQRLTATIAVAGAIAAASTGITYAATSHASVYGCTNSHGTLRLLSAQGTCAHGYHKVAISQRGATGARGTKGAKGANGAKGAPGPAGPHPVMVAAESTTSATTTVDRAIPGTGLIMHASCGAGLSSVLSLIDTTGTGDYDVDGTAQFLGQSSDGYWVNNSVIHDLPIGPGLVAYQQDAAKSAVSELVDKQGEINADLLVARNGKSFTLRIVLLQNDKDCLAQAQATPAT